jgi:hypothetical protein
MKSFPRPVQWLRNRRRSAKFVILLVAAWAPFLLAHRPLWAGAIMTCAAVVFLTATNFGRATIVSEKPRDDPA